MIEPSETPPEFQLLRELDAATLRISNRVYRMAADRFKVSADGKTFTIRPPAWWKKSDD